MSDLAVGKCLNDCASYALVYETSRGLRCDVCDALHHVCIMCSELVLAIAGELCELHATSCAVCSDTAEDRARKGADVALYDHPDGGCCRACIPVGHTIMLADDCEQWARSAA